MEQYLIPTLSVDGWTSNKNVQMGKLFEYFLASDYSQSNTFRGSIASLKYIMHAYNDSNQIVTEIEKALYELYINYYDTVTVDVSVTESDINSEITFYINIIASYKDKRYVLAKDIKESNGDIVNFDELLYDIHNTYLENE